MPTSGCRLTVDAEVVEEQEGSYELIGNLSVYMLAPSVGSKDKVAGEVRDAFRKYNFSQKKYKVDLYGQPVSYWKSTFMNIVIRHPIGEN